jgi:hypothetical protein
MSSVIVTVVCFAMGGIIAPIARKHLIQNVSHPAVSAKPSFKVFAAYAARDTKQHGDDDNDVLPLHGTAFAVRSRNHRTCD